MARDWLIVPLGVPSLSFGITPLVLCAFAELFDLIAVHHQASDIAHLYLALALTLQPRKSGPRPRIMPSRGRASFVSVVNPFIPLILRFWKRICLTLLLLVLVAVALLCILFVLPLMISDAHESQHFTEIEHYESQESLDRWTPEFKSLFDDGLPPMHERPTRLIQDVIQLTSSSWQGHMALYPDGTSEYPMQSYWIYVAGSPLDTSEPIWKRIWRRSSAYSMPGGSCADPPEMCNGFNEAFQQLIDDWAAKKLEATSRGIWRFIDCDHSPLLCDNFLVDPVMVIRAEVPEGACEMQLEPRVAWACNVKWSYIGLPLKVLPFQRKTRLDDGRLVPAFPSPYEQLYQTIMLHEGLDALEVLDPPYVEWANVTDATREHMKSLKPFFDRRNPEDD